MTTAWLKSNGFKAGDRMNGWSLEIGPRTLRLEQNSNSGWNVLFGDRASWGEQPSEAILKLYLNSPEHAEKLRHLVFPPGDFEMLQEAGFKFDRGNWHCKRAIQGLQVHVIRSGEKDGFVWEVIVEAPIGKPVDESPIGKRMPAVQGVDLRPLLQTVLAGLDSSAQEIAQKVIAERRAAEAKVAACTAALAEIERHLYEPFPDEVEAILPDPEQQHSTWLALSSTSIQEEREWLEASGFVLREVRGDETMWTRPAGARTLELKRHYSRGSTWWLASLPGFEWIEPKGSYQIQGALKALNEHIRDLHYDDEAPANLYEGELDDLLFDREDFCVLESAGFYRTNPRFNCQWAMEVQGYVTHMAHEQDRCIVPRSEGKGFGWAPSAGIYEHAGEYSDVREALQAIPKLIADSRACEIARLESILSHAPADVTSWSQDLERLQANALLPFPESLLPYLAEAP